MEDGKIFGHSRCKATLDFAPKKGWTAQKASGRADFPERFPELLLATSAPMPARSAPMPARPRSTPRRPAQMPDGSLVVPGRGDGHGLKLLTCCSTASASQGEQIIASIYILNVGLEVLQDVRLVPRQFSNADMTELAYSSFPCEEELSIETMLPGTHRGWICRYQVTAADVLSGGPIISSLAATAITSDGDAVRDECDLILEVRWSGDDDWDGN